jgi:hypothetical protein
MPKYTEEEKKQRHRDAVQRWKKKNREKHNEYCRLSYQRNKDAINARRRARRKQKKAELLKLRAMVNH